jgi:hypothetical protein
MLALTFPTEIGTRLFFTPMSRKYPVLCFVLVVDVWIGSYVQTGLISNHYM